MLNKSLHIRVNIYTSEEEGDGEVFDLDDEMPLADF